MKSIFIYLTVLLCFLSCNLNNERKITQVEFRQLLMADTIGSIQLHNDNPARIYKKPFHNNDKPYILEIESQESFKYSLEKDLKALAIKNIHPRFNFGWGYSPERSDIFLEALQIILFLVNLLIIGCIIILFIIAIKDILKSKFESATDKLIWVLVVILVPIIGPLLYIYIGKKKRKLN